MFSPSIGNPNKANNDKEGRCMMDDTKQFIDKLHDKQQKDEQNRQRQGKGHPEKKLQNKQH
jgi:hypothetical protein